MLFSIIQSEDLSVHFKQLSIIEMPSMVITMKGLIQNLFDIIGENAARIGIDITETVEKLIEIRKCIRTNEIILETEIPRSPSH